MAVQNKILQATSGIVAILEPLSSEERSRVLNAALIQRRRLARGGLIDRRTLRHERVDIRDPDQDLGRSVRQPFRYFDLIEIFRGVVVDGTTRAGRASRARPHSARPASAVAQDPPTAAERRTGRPPRSRSRP